MSERTFTGTDGSGFPLHRGLILEQSLCPAPWFLLPWALLKPGSKVHHTINSSSVNDFEGSTFQGLSRKSTGPISKVILESSKILFLIIRILKTKKGTSKKTTGTVSNHKLYDGYPILQRLTQTSSFIGNCSNMAEQTLIPDYFLCYASPSLPAREGDQRFVVGLLDAVGKADKCSSTLSLTL